MLTTLLPPSHKLMSFIRTLRRPLTEYHISFGITVFKAVYGNGLKQILYINHSCVIIDKLESEFLLVLSAVPQGSILGSTLFVIFI